MKNAFSILGATPFDNVDKLQKLFEEKQLFLDDDTEINYAYTELTNLKKRIKHEVRYLSKGVFEKFNSIFLNNHDDEQEIVVDDMCSAIIEVGKWFDLDHQRIFSLINGARKNAGFTPVGDEEVLQGAINEFKEECLLGVKRYFDFFKEKEIVTWFNALVKQDDYMSFFIDDLLVFYEDAMSQSIKKKEIECVKKFDSIKLDVNLYLRDDVLLFNVISDKIKDFKKSLGAWDIIVQPLQVNFGKRGGQHEASADFANSLRNTVIEMFNKSQESLTRLFDPNFYLTHNSYSGSIQYDIVFKIIESTKLIQLLENILNIMEKYFSELDDFAERLKQDKMDFANIKSELSIILNSLDPHHTHRNRIERNSEKSNQKDYYTNQQPEKTIDDTWTKIIRWLVGITILVAGIGTIVCFAHESTAMGVIFLIMAIITVSCAYNWGQLNIELDTMKVVAVALAIIIGTACIVSLVVNLGSSSYSSYSVSLTSTNFEGYFTLNSSCSLSYDGASSKKATYTYSISPKSSFKYSDNSSNPSSITVTIGLDISSYSSSYGTPSDYKIYITLYRSNGYKTSGTRIYNNLSISKNYWNDGIYSVSGTIYP